MLSPTRSQRFILSAVLFTSSLSAQVPTPQMSASARQYLTQALDAMEKNSVHRKDLDWSAIRSTAMGHAAGAETAADTYEAIRSALKALGDHHSFLQLSPELQLKDKEAREKRHDALGVASGDEKWPPSPYIDRRIPEGHLQDVEGTKVAVLVIPTIEASDDGALHNFANALQGKIAELSREHPVGWIVDLRGNLGGDMWPMLAGIGPLAGDSTLGSFVDADGTKTNWFYAEDGAGLVTPDKKRSIQLWMPGQQVRFSATPPVAVLIDRGTASSGEAVALSFHGRPNCRLFGRHTHGQTTANDGFALPDGANLVITTGLEADRSGTVFPDGITPEAELPEETQLQASGGIDPMMRVAAAWIKAQARGAAN